MAVAPPLRDTIPVSGDRELLDAVLDAATSLIVVVDADARLVRWNRACEQLLGYSAAGLDAPGAVLKLVPASERSIADEAIEALKAGESPVRTEFHWRTSAGILRLIAWSITALTGPDGEVTYMDGALLLLDLDDFKAVNDGHGHRAGDRVLTAVAAVLRNRLRESDVVARFGGDEFAVLMPHGGEAEAAELADVLVEAIRTDVRAPEGPLGASVGFAVFEESATADEMLSAADDAMYADKARERAPVRHLRPVE